MNERDEAADRRDDSVDKWNEATRAWEDELERARQAGFGSLQERDHARQEQQDALARGEYGPR